MSRGAKLFLKFVIALALIGGGFYVAMMQLEKEHQETLKNGPISVQK